ncbi:MAG: hypothetical protein WBL25_08215 [Anaerolineales bacterium]
MRRRFDYGARRLCVWCKGKAYLRSPVPHNRCRQRAFIQLLVILFVLMMIAGILTLVLLAG